MGSLHRAMQAPFSILNARFVVAKPRQLTWLARLEILLEPEPYTALQRVVTE